MALCVNGVVITEEAIQFELGRLIRFYSGHLSADEVRRQMEALKRKAREQAIGARLLIEEAERLDFQIPETEVADRLNGMLEKAGGKAAFDDMCRRQHLTPDMVKQSIERGRRVDMLIERVTAGVPDPAEEDMQAHFDAHREEYMRPGRAEVRHVLIRPASAGAADREVVRSRLQEIRARIEQGESFADLAAMHSECPSGRRSGGGLGWVSRGTMVREFEDAVFALDAGRVSDVIESPLGFHIVCKTAEEPPEPAAYDEVRDRVRDFLRHVSRGEAIAAYVADLRQKAVIEGA